ncbi:hypothetical protein C3B44_00445 [Corynebacterium yudongzhengii]|uniref:YCII-related domain-containing protein n=1 Tax=Corynebacterium yudongzhengii TaxID=2080740 RepID=A0A2U1T463_9CORY|nr:hypothetical protein [Corynebacterium yudongzhengii]AWB81005.1 hypothetical protein C3B44_00445 [Corynebacterium yudongzhengii]PWC00773.1 hypothetical protein DF222_10950 [Corynebacterium yudongzhengii]
MPQFLLAAVYDPDTAPGFDSGVASGVDEFNRSLEAHGQLVTAVALTPPRKATTVSTCGRLGDGPLRPGGLQLGEFWIVEVDNRAAAQALAVRAARACGRGIELRELA